MPLSFIENSQPFLTCLAVMNISGDTSWNRYFNALLIRFWNKSLISIGYTLIVGSGATLIFALQPIMEESRSSKTVFTSSFKLVDSRFMLFPILAYSSNPVIISDIRADDLLM